MDASNLEAIESMAALQFSLAEVAIICQLEEGDIAASESATKAFLKGRLQAQAEVRQALLQQARQGSTPALKQFQELADRSEPTLTPTE